MGQVTKLCDVISRLSAFDIEYTIYASAPWTDKSDAMVAKEPDAGGLPLEVSNAGLHYFLEISIAKEFVEDWIASLDEKPTPSTLCLRVIDYATNDA
ncbi:hypothetical protein [Aquidulcibacter sp.]|jgi:hypothetical protein|uniref:hypothetical protein n=1 Tax=Aquidulcibacter sp. TaxID=2052990 RepID=UPI0037BFAC49